MPPIEMLTQVALYRAVANLAGATLFQQSPDLLGRDVLLLQPLLHPPVLLPKLGLGRSHPLRKTAALGLAAEKTGQLRMLRQRPPTVQTSLDRQPLVL
ncbi:MAG: hypothetical protein L7F78_12490, partial [Syntrophales bacterium LBB04]|nr:hypothetical protein [Syntrophales bacterium LBB04]